LPPAEAIRRQRVMMILRVGMCVEEVGLDPEKGSAAIIEAGDRRANCAHAAVQFPL